MGADKQRQWRKPYERTVDGTYHPMVGVPVSSPRLPHYLQMAPVQHGILRFECIYIGIPQGDVQPWGNEDGCLGYGQIRQCYLLRQDQSQTSPRRITHDNDVPCFRSFQHLPIEFEQPVGRLLECVHRSFGIEGNGDDRPAHIVDPVEK